MAVIEAMNSAESVEWYTPAEYVEAVRYVLGFIELDPASCALANRTVKAERIFTIETDGLQQPWNARTLFLNPPYGWAQSAGRRVSSVQLWIQKLIAEFEAGRTREAILLVNASTSEVWFQPLWAYVICFTDHRIAFDLPAGDKNNPVKGNAFVYFGHNPMRFYNGLNSFGVVTKRYRGV